MKLVIAVVRAEKLLAVDRTIGQPGVFLSSVSRAIDVRDPQATLYRGPRTHDPESRVRLEIVALNEALVPGTIRAILESAVGAEPWRQGSGYVLVVPLDEPTGADAH
jgi:nitrogen regulatory protein PII